MPISPREAWNFFFAFIIRMGSRGTFVLCTARSRYMRINAAERRSGEVGHHLSTARLSTGQSVPSAVMM